MKENDKILLKIIIDLPPKTKKTGEHIEYRDGKPRIVQSRIYLKYQKDCRRFMPRLQEPISVPVNVSTKFYMPTRKRVDIINLIQAAHDILVWYGVLKDDCMKYIKSIDGSSIQYDPINPRTEIVISSVEDDNEQWMPER